MDGINRMEKQRNAWVQNSPVLFILSKNLLLGLGRKPQTVQPN